jgi:glycerophosphoryl diester phosphodiesterase
VTAAIYGHRGARGEAPENTIAGFRHAAAIGVAAIETDIALTADLVPVLHHDPALPDGRLLRDLRYAELSGIPTLAESLAAVPDIDWLLEIKTFPDYPDRSHEPEIVVRAVLAALAATQIPNFRVSVMAFEWAVLQQLRRHAPAIARVCLSAPPQEAARALWWGSGYDGLTTPQAAARFGAAAWSPLHKTLTAQTIAEARRLGLRVIAWTVNDPAEFARLAPLVDGITTDFPTRFLAARR